jgi:hypothetical protein
MALNPFFLQGSSGEQNLVQELINEQLKIYGIEVTYIPRKFVRKQTILEEIQSSKFDDNFLLEAYINNYEGYSGAGDIMTKFGVSVRDELSLVISRERFEDFIAPFLEEEDDNLIEIFDRPREGDLIYFPLGKRLFEVKFVEHEKPFYQLGKNYVFELQCELFEYEDEVLDTTIDAIDSVIDDKGYIIDLRLFDGGSTAVATATTGTGYISEITLENDGYGFTSTPLVGITTAPTGGTNATAVAITTTRNNITSVKEILITNAGSGYTVAPTITITGGGGAGAAATCGIRTDSTGVISIFVSDAGSGYSTAPTVTIGSPTSGVTATGRAALNSLVLNPAGVVSQIYVLNPGSGYTSTPSVVVGAASTTGIGTFWFNEVITGSISGTTARVKRWDTDTNILRIGITTGGFLPGELITGAKSNAQYIVAVSSANTSTDKYRQNDEIELQADNIIDFTESNPFGTY